MENEKRQTILDGIGVEAMANGDVEEELGASSSEGGITWEQEARCQDIEVCVNRRYHPMEQEQEQFEDQDMESLGGNIGEDQEDGT